MKIKIYNNRLKKRENHTETSYDWTEKDFWHKLSSLFCNFYPQPYLKI